MTEVKTTVSEREMSHIPELFDEFSRVTAKLASSHEVLVDQVQGLKRELAAKNRRLERKKRLESLGRVAAGVAHEFRNPLGGIRLTLDGLLASQLGDAVDRKLRRAHHAVLHLDDIVEDLLTFTHPRSIEPARVRTADLVDGAIALAFPEDDLDGSVSRDGPADHELDVDRTAMTQVLVNLLVNAGQAVRDGGGQIGVWWGSRDGNPWLEVADGGTGIPAGEEERIFLPFHSLRDGGTGLGLAIVQGRVEAHDGEIGVVSDSWGGGSDWAGARFRILLPAKANEKE